MTQSDVQATFCATLLDEWCRAGVSHAVVSPGSRSTPMALAVAAEPRLSMLVVLDERSAAFVALGLARSTGFPAVVVCTSGTAAAEYHPAVAEGHLDRVPMIVVTSDRPPELHGIGAPQTLDQNRLFGRSVRDFFEPGVADRSTASTWRSLASRAFLAATAGAFGPGPVHLNLAFREPLVGRPQRLPAARRNGEPWHGAFSAHTGGTARTGFGDVGGVGLDRALIERLSGRRGVVVAGAGCGDPAAIRELAEGLGWPLLADLRSGARGTGARGTGATPSGAASSGATSSGAVAASTGPVVVDHVDAILRSPVASKSLHPEVVLRFGAPWASKVLNQWLATVADDILVDPHHAWLDPNRASHTTVHADPTGFAKAIGSVVQRADASWSRRWAKADAVSRATLHRLLEGTAHSTSSATNAIGTSEPAWVRCMIAALPAASDLVISSSMPIRHAEWFSVGRDDIRIHSNRGANGIDGVVSTSLGVAAAGVRPTFALIGDLAFLHDAGALALAGQGHLNCTFVVIDNAGGGIFEFLPQATNVERSRFEVLYGTPQNVDIIALAKAYGLRTAEPKTLRALTTTLGKFAGVPGVKVVVLRTDRRETVKVLERLNAAVAASVEAALRP